MACAEQAFSGRWSSTGGQRDRRSTSRGSARRTWRGASYCRSRWSGTSGCVPYGRALFIRGSSGGRALFSLPSCIPTSAASPRGRSSTRRAGAPRCAPTSTGAPPSTTPSPTGPTGPSPTGSSSRSCAGRSCPASARVKGCASSMPAAAPGAGRSASSASCRGATALLADVSSGMLEVARRKAARSGARDRLSLLELDLNTPLPRRLGLFDVVLCFHNVAGLVADPAALDPAPRPRHGARRPRRPRPPEPLAGGGQEPARRASRRARPPRDAKRRPLRRRRPGGPRLHAVRRTPVSGEGRLRGRRRPRLSRLRPPRRARTRSSPRISTTRGSSGGSYRWRRSSACPRRPRREGTASWRSGDGRGNSKTGLPERARTADPRLRRPMLYPAELRAGARADGEGL